MQIQCMPILKVIFVLSTIVAVTDCCSSRILLLRQHTLQIEEHVVQLVNQLELQQQLNADEQQQIELDLIADAAQMLQVLPELDFERKLATIGTTEHDSSTDLLPWPTEETTTTASTLASTTTTASTSTTMTSTSTAETTASTSTTAKTTSMLTTTTTASTSTTTNTMQTGEPPPNDSTPQLATEAAILNLEKAATTTTTTTTTPTPIISSTVARNTELLDYSSSHQPCTPDLINVMCLNGGNCFRVKNVAWTFCECASDYVGERCESKTENGVYVPLQAAMSEPQLKTAHIVFSFPMLILLSTIYVVFGAVYMLRTLSAQRRKQQQLHLDKQRFFVSC